MVIFFGSKIINSQNSSTEIRGIHPSVIRISCFIVKIKSQTSQRWEYKMSISLYFYTTMYQSYCKVRHYAPWLNF